MMHGRACKQCSFGPITRLPSVLRFLGTVISPASVKKKTTVIGHFQVISIMAVKGLKEESEAECLAEREEEFHITGPIY